MLGGNYNKCKILGPEKSVAKRVFWGMRDTLYSLSMPKPTTLERTGFAGSIQEVLTRLNGEAACTSYDQMPQTLNDTEEATGC